MSIINFNYNNRVISQREDGYINLTQMCQANGKRLDNYFRLKATSLYIQELENSLRCEVVHTKEGNTVEAGTWGHPTLAVNLARWVSPAFAVWCDAHIFNLMSTGETSLDIDPLEKMRLELEIAKTNERAAIAQQNAANANQKLLATVHAMETFCPGLAPLALGKVDAVVERVEYVDRVIDRPTGRVTEGVNITYLTKKFGFKSTKECWNWLNSIGYGKESGHWEQQLYAGTTWKLPPEKIREIQRKFKIGERQLFLGE